MKRCNHTQWLGLCNQGNEVALLESDRLQTLTKYIHNPNIRQPSLLVLIGNAAKSTALRELFGVKRVRRFRTKRSAGEIHLHLDPSTTFHGRPILIADTNLPSQTLRAKSATADKCHDTTRRIVRCHTGSPGVSLDDIAVSVYTRLLFPFVDVFCFFSADLGGFKQIARHVAAWLEKGSSSTLPKCTYPRVIIVIDKIPPGAGMEKEARKGFLWLLEEETTKDPFDQISAIDIVALFPAGTMSDEARYRLLKERLMDGSDQVRKGREDTRLSFSATHFGALFKYASEHFAETIDQPFNFIKASRTCNPIAPDLEDHLSTFLKHATNLSELTEFVVPIIASSFFLDNYPPDAHSKSALSRLCVNYLTTV
jgi:hypothetical protein